MKLSTLQKFSPWLLASALSLALAACGGASDAPATLAPVSSTLSGVAAVGDPIVSGSVTVQCAGGGSMTTTTASNGTWQVSTTTHTMPCAARVSGGTIAGVTNSINYHSLALNFGNLNITPLTDLVVANTVRGAPATWFSGIGASSWSAVTSAAVAAAKTNVANSLGFSAPLGSNDLLTTAFTAAQGNLLDDMLEAFARAMTAAGSNYASFVSSASGATITMPAGYNFGSAYTIVIGGGTGGGGGGAGSLTIRVTAAGVAAPPITVSGGFTVPTSQAQFCDGVVSDTTFRDIASGAGGTFTINSCTFSGRVGTINATLALISPVGVTISYAITYTYN